VFIFVVYTNHEVEKFQIYNSALWLHHTVQKRLCISRKGGTGRCGWGHPQFAVTWLCTV